MAAPRFRWWLSWRMWVVAVLLFIAIWRWQQNTRDSRWSLGTANVLPAGRYVVTRVVDGDTLRVKLPSTATETGEITVRLLGINCPEDTTKREPFGAEATAFLRENAGTEVWLEWDKRRIDKFGRRLAYVYVDDRFLNQELVRRGLARVFSYPGDNSTIARDLSRTQELAEREGVGIWSVGKERPALDPVTENVDH